MFERFNHLTSEQLKRRQQLSKWSIIIGIIGAAIGIGASFYKYNLTREFPAQTLEASVICLVVTLFMFVQLKRISQVKGAKS